MFYSFIVTIILYNPLTQSYHDHNLAMDTHLTAEDCQKLVELNQQGRCEPDE